MKKFFCIMAFCSSLIQAGEWRADAPLNTPRYGAAVAVLNGQIYIMGGATSGGTILNIVERFDPLSGSWDASSVAAFEQPRLDAAAAVLNNRIFLTGGLTAEGEVKDKVEIYDPMSNSWEEGKEMLRDRRGHIAVIINNTVCVMGGIRDNGEHISEIEYWQEEGWKMAEDDLIAVRVNPFAVAHNDIIYMFGGIFNFPSNAGYQGTHRPDWHFDWTNTPNLQSARGNGATALLDKEIFILGGINSSASATNAVEIFHIDSGRLAEGPSLPTARIGMSAAVLDEVIYVIGGYVDDPGQPLSLVESYDTMVAIDPGPENRIPVEFAQLSAYPNPFNGTVQLQIRLPRRISAELTIYDLQGREVKAIHQGTLAAGEHHFQWTACDNNGGMVASGIYLAVLKGEDILNTFKVVYIK